MSDKKDGGPAFCPICGHRELFAFGGDHVCESIGAYFHRVWLRDFFAAAALSEFVKRHPGEPSHAAECAYEVADAMLIAREAKP